MQQNAADMMAVEVASAANSEPNSLIDCEKINQRR